MLRLLLSRYSFAAFEGLPAQIAIVHFGVLWMDYDVRDLRIFDRGVFVCGLWKLVFEKSV